MPKTLKQFKHQEVIRKPTTVKFTTKDGKLVGFPATKIIRRPKQVKFNVKPRGSKKQKTVCFTARR